MQHWIAAGALAWLAAGCATTVPALDRAAVALPVAWAGAAPSGTLRSSADARWWRAFADDTLSRTVEAALAANADLATARANLRRARALRDVAAAGLRPSLSVSAAAQRTDPARQGIGNLFDAGFDASWEPDLFGATGHAVAAVAADARASEFNLAAAQVSLAAEVVADYLQLRGTQARISLATENLAAQEETLEIARWRQQAGLASSLEVEQARGAVEQTRAQLPSLRASGTQTRHALAVLAGRVPQALDAELQAAVPLPQPPQDIAVDIPARVLRQRPDVQAAEAQLLGAAERVAEADAARRPTVALRASLAWSAASLGSLGSAGAVSTLLASVAQPLFDGGQRRAQLDAQLAAFDVARESYRARVLVALQDVEDALSALEGSRDRLAALRNAEDAAASAALLASQRYASGIVDFQTVLDTQRNRLVVQDSRAGAETEWVTSHVRLVKALGGGWNDAALPIGLQP